MNEIQQLKREGLGVSDIRDITGFSRPTIRKCLSDPCQPQYGPRAKRATKLDPFKDFIRERLAAGVWNAVVLQRELKERGYTGGYSILTDHLRPLRQEAKCMAVRRFETPPGHQAQVDWGDIGQVCLSQERKKLSGFVFTLGHSRALFADVATDETLPTLLRMHEAAFAELGGVPKEVLYDRMKTVALGVDARDEIRWHPLFFDFARYWGFVPRLCRAYRPQTKGKVESGIRYVRGNFLCGRTAQSVLDLRSQLHTWVWQVANQRVHGTTHEAVLTAWQQEKLHLIPLAGRSAYPYLVQEMRRVARDAYVSYRGNRYSVPWRAAGQEVMLREMDGALEISRLGERLAVHPLCEAGRHQTVTVAAHHAGIPLGSPQRGKARILIAVQSPQVEVRSLLAYEAVLIGGDCP